MPVKDYEHEESQHQEQPNDIQDMAYSRGHSVDLRADFVPWPERDGEAVRRHSEQYEHRNDQNASRWFQVTGSYRSEVDDCSGHEIRDAVHEHIAAELRQTLTCRVRMGVGHELSMTGAR